MHKVKHLWRNAQIQSGTHECVHTHVPYMHTHTYTYTETQINILDKHPLPYIHTQNTTYVCYKPRHTQHTWSQGEDTLNTSSIRIEHTHNLETSCRGLKTSASCSCSKKKKKKDKECHQFQSYKYFVCFYDSRLYSRLQTLKTTQGRRSYPKTSKFKLHTCTRIMPRMQDWLCITQQYQSIKRFK